MTQILCNFFLYTFSQVKSWRNLDEKSKECEEGLIELESKTEISIQKFKNPCWLPSMGLNQ